MLRFNRTALFASTLLALVACVDQAEPAELPEAAAPGNQPHAGMGPADSMSSPGAYPGTYMMGDMTAYMGAMEGMSTDSLHSLMPMYRERVDSMLVQMNRDMSARNMPPDPSWDATVDSIRSDATRMRGMAATEMETFMGDHRGRVMRLMERHRAMTSAESEAGRR